MTLLADILSPVAAHPAMNDSNAAVMRGLYAEHAGALWRCAVRLTGGGACAEEVVQETLLRAEDLRIAEGGEVAWLHYALHAQRLA